ncbi:hypothetical protein XELAEV_18035716mg [Xenopus laevis]|uniref:G-protein coupled receptors family 1 profile domain-containing protein n=1 Tax=Xenopus laevis TaxID=8355 RepID=A0A974CGI8_XENLA|nr:hypothetical protein XELAEV_18035716mg [Xenopus laevis]
MIKWREINHTSITEFILAGFTVAPAMQRLLFVIFFNIYVITVLGNVLISVAYRRNSNLHTPMYYLLSNFSFLETCYVSATVPKLLSDLLAEEKRISFYECYVLAAMACDRYHAISNPLLYCVTMNDRVCAKLIAGSLLIGAVNSLVHTSLTYSLPFCDANEINHFFCDVLPVLELACTDTQVNEMAIFVLAGAVIVGSLILTIISYSLIIFTILNISSKSGKRKAFSTCASHFASITIFYGSEIFMYLRPKSSHVMDQDSFISVMYTVISPLLNPFIYTIRNTEFKASILKLIYQRPGLQKS